MGRNGLRVREQLPEIIARGAAALTPAEKELLKWVGVFFRRPTPGKFMMRVRMPNGFVTSRQLRAIADLSRRIGNNVLDITTRQQLELRGFTLDSVPEIWEKLRGVDLRFPADRHRQHPKHQRLRPGWPFTDTNCSMRLPWCENWTACSWAATAIRNSPTCRASSTSP